MHRCQRSDVPHDSGPGDGGHVHDPGRHQHRGRALRRLGPALVRYSGTLRWHAGVPSDGSSTHRHRRPLRHHATRKDRGSTHTDAIGSIRAVTDVNGLLVAARNDYLPFGEVFSGVSGDPTVTRRLFSGKERDAESGFDYFGARYYASGIGRFTATDPVTLISSAQADPQLWNKYAYVRNSPLGHTDPDGRCPDACVVEAGVAYGVYETVVVTAAGAAWLVSPSGRAAVAQVGRDIGTMATTAAGKIQSWFQTEKRPGTLGKPDHQATAEEERQRINGEREVRIDTPGGKKDFRKADAAGTNPETGAKEIVQVYRPTPAGNIPKREKDAAADIHQHDGTKPTMVPVRPIPKKPQPETP